MLFHHQTFIALLMCGYLEGVVALYGLALVFEMTDIQIFKWTHKFVSGHTLKHIAAGLAGLWLFRKLR